MSRRRPRRSAAVRGFRVHYRQRLVHREHPARYVAMLSAARPPAPGGRSVGSPPCCVRTASNCGLVSTWSIVSSGHTQSWPYLLVGQVGCHPDPASSAASRTPASRTARNGSWSWVALKSPTTSVGPWSTAAAGAVADRLQVGQPLARTLQRIVRMDRQQPERLGGSHLYVDTALAERQRPRCRQRVAGERHRPVRAHDRFPATVRQQLGQPGLEQPIQRLRGDLLEHEHVDVLAGHGAHDGRRVTAAELEVRRHHRQVGLRRRYRRRTAAPAPRPARPDPVQAITAPATTHQRPWRPAKREQADDQDEHEPDHGVRRERGHQHGQPETGVHEPHRGQDRHGHQHEREDDPEDLAHAGVVAPAQASCSYAASSPASDSLTRAVNRVPSAVCSTERTSPFSWTRLTRSPRS